MKEEVKVGIENEGKISQNGIERDLETGQNDIGTDRIGADQTDQKDMRNDQTDTDIDLERDTETLEIGLETGQIDQDETTHETTETDQISHRMEITHVDMTEIH